MYHQIMNDDVAPMIRYVTERYATVSSLDEVAKRYAMSASTASRRFKEETGKTFSEYIVGLRLEYAAHDLVSNDSSIADIAQSNGFSSSSVFSRVFKSAYGISPREYRARYKIQQDQHITRNIRVSHNAKGTALSVTLGVSLGPSGNMGVPSVRSHMLKLIDNLHITRIHIGNILSDFIFQHEHQRFAHQDKIYEGFEASIVDGVFDDIVERGLAVTLDLTNRGWSINQSWDKNLVTVDKPELLQDPRQIITLTTSLLRHWCNRYEACNLHNWRLDIGYDPTLSDIDSYVNMLRSITAAARDILPSCKVGGCTISPKTDRPLFTTFVETLQQQNFTPDYVTLHSHACSLTTATGTLSSERSGHQLKEEIQTTRRILDSHGISSPIQVSEWNPVPSQRNCYNDSSEKAAMMLQELTGCLDLPININYASLSDYSSMYSDVDTLFFGGTGLVSKDGFNKPVLHAFQFCEQLLPHIIARGDGYVVSRDDDSYIMLLWNSTGLNRRYMQAKEYELTRPQLKLYYQQDHDVDYVIEIADLPRNRYLLREYHVDDEAGNAIAAAEQYNIDEHVPKSDYRFVDAAALPRFFARRITKSHGIVRFPIHIASHGFALIKMTELH